MSEVVEETEPESSFKETDKKGHFRANKGSEVPHTVHETEEYHEEESKISAVDKIMDQPDRDDDFSEESEDEETKVSKNNGLTFMGGRGLLEPSNDVAEAKDMTKLTSVERIKEYLSKELGQAATEQIYPIIKGFGDDILSGEKINELKQ